MRVKGEARFELVDQITGEVRTFEQTNFIFNYAFRDMMSNDKLINNIYITTGQRFPQFNRELYYSNDESRIFGTNEKIVFYPKTSDSPPYVEVYALFLPSVQTRYINAIGVASKDSQTTNYYSAINLRPVCEQKNTEYLNIYYRIILVDDEKDVENNDWVKNEFTRGLVYKRKFYENGYFTTYPFRIEEDLSKNGNTNFLVGNSDSLTRIVVSTPTKSKSEELNGVYRHISRNEVYPQFPPNQYQQLTNEYLNTVLRFGKNGVEYYNIYLHPHKFTHDLGAGNTGIGNVFGTNDKVFTNMFDPTNFAVGSGRVFASGQWSVGKNPFPSRYVVNIKKTGATLSDATYNVVEWPTSPTTQVPFLPTSETKSIQYKDPSRMHFGATYAKMTQFQWNRSYIGWDQTGISICDLYHGKVHSFDALSTPALPVTDVVMVKTDITGLIWVACANTGLWKIRFDQDKDIREVTQIGAPPGCQPRCYALDSDDDGNVFAVFWGLGLHYTSDAGQSWVNAIINYQPFSDMDDGGANSKWRFCTKIVVNPHRSAKAGNAQVLLLYGNNGPDKNLTAGCWYDQISANTTGITDHTIRNVFQDTINLPHKRSIVVTKSGKWVVCKRSFVSNNQTIASVVDGQNNTFNRNLLTTLDFQQNSGVVGSFFNLSNSSDEFHKTSTLELFWYERFSPRDGKQKEYIVVPNVFQTDSCVIDVESGQCMVSNESVSSYHDSRYGCYLVIGDNVFATSNHSIKQIVRPKKQYEFFLAFTYGFDGGKWVRDHLGTRPAHRTQEDFIKGIKLEFRDGPAGTTSFSAGDQYTFTCFDGYFKDNSSKLWINDSIYYKPKEIVNEFWPPVVSLYDRSHDVGPMVDPNIGAVWDISRLPDTNFDGRPLVTDGDDDLGNVVLLAPLEADINDHSTLKAQGVVVGDLQTDGTVKINWPDGSSNNTTYFNGSSYVKFQGQQFYFTTPFTIEAWVYQTNRSLDSSQFILDMRNNSNTQMGALSVNKFGRIEWWDGQQTLGGVGPSLNLNQWHHVALSRRTGNRWELALDGVVISNWSSDIQFTSPKVAIIGSRYDHTTEWTTRNIQGTRNVQDPFGGNMASRIQFLNNGYVGYKTFPSTTKKMVFSFYLKATSKVNIELRFGVVIITDYHPNNNTFDHSHFTGEVETKVLTDGWVRLIFKFTPSFNSNQGVFNMTANSGVVDFYGPMLHEGEVALPYEPSGSTTNLIPTDSDNVLGSLRGFQGHLSNVRITATKERYVGNFAPPTKPFPDHYNDYIGLSLVFSPDHHQGSVVSKKELVGDWEISFHSIHPDLYRLRSGRPGLVFGVTSTPFVQNLSDLSVRVVPQGNGYHVQRWLESYSLGNKIDHRTSQVVMRKDGHWISVFTRINSELALVGRYEDRAPIHYVAFWQESPSTDPNMPNISPVVDIRKNGSAWCSKIGNPNTATGVFNKKFLAVDVYWRESYVVSLDGDEVFNRRSLYDLPDQPNEQESFVHDHGTITFHPSDAGKTITGTFISLHE